MAAEPDTSIADAVVLAVSELPDRTSPDEWPDAMLVTGEELREIIMTELRHSEATPADAGEKGLQFDPEFAQHLKDRHECIKIVETLKAEHATTIFSLRAQLEEARGKALEEAAKVAERWGYSQTDCGEPEDGKIFSGVITVDNRCGNETRIATAIRALKEEPGR